jgi:hypothetical protein
MDRNWPLCRRTGMTVILRYHCRQFTAAPSPVTKVVVHANEWLADIPGGRTDNHGSVNGRRYRACHGLKCGRGSVSTGRCAANISSRKILFQAYTFNGSEGNHTLYWRKATIPRHKLRRNDAHPTSYGDDADGGAGNDPGSVKCNTSSAVRVGLCCGAAKTVDIDSGTVGKAPPPLGGAATRERLNRIVGNLTSGLEPVGR